MYLVSLLECKMRGRRSTKKQGHPLVVDESVFYFLRDFEDSENSYLQFHITGFSFYKKHILFRNKTFLGIFASIVKWATEILHGLETFTVTLRQCDFKYSS